mgnify:CR=1 FL=1
MDNYSKAIGSTNEYITFLSYLVASYEKMFGLILYNPSDREGAVEEADNLQSGLKAIEYRELRKEWTTDSGLSTPIDECFAELTSLVCVIWLCKINPMSCMCVCVELEFSKVKMETELLLLMMSYSDFSERSQMTHQL